MALKAKKAKTRLHDIDVSAVRIVPKGANARNGWLICKSADPDDTDTGATEATDQSARETHVNKAVALATGESVSQFLDAIRAAFREHVNPSGNDDSSMWICDVFDIYLVADKYEDSKTTYYQYTWLRNADGTFTFGDSVEVVRQVSFAPVAKGDEDQNDGNTVPPVAEGSTETPPETDTEPTEAEKAAEAKAKADAEAETEQARKDTQKTLRRLQGVLRNHVHAIVDTILVAPEPEPEPAPAVAAPAPEPAVKAAPRIPQGARSNALTSQTPVTKSFEWHPGDLNTLEVE